MEILIRSILEKKAILDGIISIKRMHGGCINDAFSVKGTEKEVFIKVNSTGFSDMFEKEARGLKLLGSTNTVQVPEVIESGKSGNNSYLVLSFIPKEPFNKIYWENLGNAVAALHKRTDHAFGLDEDNYIGALPQKNSRRDNWILFLKENRLKNLLPREDHSLKSSFEKLFKKLPEILPEEKPSLLHGDLWSGNIVCGVGSVPYVVDPAVYYGNREIELAFTTLFGGFDARFYEAYQAQFPMQTGYKERFDIYNMYPLLVHHHLFGGGYLNQVRAILKKFV